MCIIIQASDESEILCTEEYEEAVQEMSLMNFQKKKARAKLLMERTQATRRRWILGDNPPTSAVFDMFPLLKEPLIVSTLDTN